MAFLYPSSILYNLSYYPPELVMVKIRKRMRMVEQLISLAGTYGWGALARK